MFCPKQSNEDSDLKYKNQEPFFTFQNAGGLGVGTVPAWIGVLGQGQGPYIELIVPDARHALLQAGKFPGVV